MTKYKIYILTESRMTQYINRKNLNKIKKDSNESPRVCTYTGGVSRLTLMVATLFLENYKGIINFKLPILF